MAIVPAAQEGDKGSSFGDELLVSGLSEERSERRGAWVALHRTCVCSGGHRRGGSEVRQAGAGAVDGHTRCHTALPAVPGGCPWGSWQAVPPHLHTGSLPVFPGRGRLVACSCTSCAARLPLCPLDNLMATHAYPATHTNCPDTAPRRILCMRARSCANGELRAALRKQAAASKAAPLHTANVPGMLGCPLPRVAHTIAL